MKHVMSNEDYAKALMNPELFSEMLEIDIAEKDFLIQSLYTMSYIRATEHKLALEKKNGKIVGPIHLGAGQEAVAVGVTKSLISTDRVFGAHRSHSHLLALKTDAYKLFAEVLGRDTGHSKGMGGSMHLWDQPNGFYGSVPIVAGTVPLAVGAGLAAKMQNTNDIAVAYIGDGAIEEGIVTESLNLASVMKVPVLFVLENNLFSSHMHISLRQPKISTSRFAEANNIECQVVDGNNLLEVAKAAEGLVDKIRESKCPAFIEAITYRHYGHVDWREDSDVGVNRSQLEIDLWKKRDPIDRLREAMIENKIWTHEEDSDLTQSISAELKNSWEKALLDPFPAESSLLERVYE
jgi:TPP-dependent pyruvate/acetoin dehydrogenase alpha subunit